MPKILVIDDNRDTAESLAVLLTLAGHDARSVTSGYAAFTALSEFTPEVCLVDIRMPGMNGYEVAARLRAIFGPGVRLLALTGELGAERDPRATVFEQVFAKPPDLGELFGAVAAASVS